MSSIDFIKDLENAGVPRKQAEVQVRAMEYYTKDHVTKEYLRAEMKLLRVEMNSKFTTLEAKMDTKFGAAEAKFGLIEGEIKVLHQKIDDLPNRMLMYYAGSTITLYVLLEKTGAFWTWLTNLFS